MTKKKGENNQLKPMTTEIVQFDSDSLERMSNTTLEEAVRSYRANKENGGSQLKEGEE